MTERITTPEVCALAGYTKATLWRRIDDGHMPKPIDRGGRGFIFDKTAVLIGLGMFDHEVKTDQATWDFDPEAYRATHARNLRRRKGARERDREGLLPGSSPPPPLRLVSGYSPSP